MMTRVFALEDSTLVTQMHGAGASAEVTIPKNCSGNRKFSKKLKTGQKIDKVLKINQFQFIYNIFQHFYHNMLIFNLDLKQIQKKKYMARAGQKPAISDRLHVTAGSTCITCMRGPQQCMLVTWGSAAHAKGYSEHVVDSKKREWIHNWKLINTQQLPIAEQSTGNIGVRNTPERDHLEPVNHVKTFDKEEHCENEDNVPQFSDTETMTLERGLPQLIMISFLLGRRNHEFGNAHYLYARSCL